MIRAPKAPRRALAIVKTAPKPNDHRARLAVECLEDRLTPVTFQFVGSGGIGSAIALGATNDEFQVAAADVPNYTIPTIPEGSGFSPNVLNQLWAATENVPNSLTGVNSQFNVWDSQNPSVLTYLNSLASQPLFALDLSPGFFLHAGTPATNGTFTVGTVDGGDYGADLQVQILPSDGEAIGTPISIVIQSQFTNLSFGYEVGQQGEGDPNLTMSYSAGYTLGGDSGTILTGTHAPPGGTDSRSGDGFVYLDTTIGATIGLSMLISGGGTSVGATGPGLIGELYLALGVVKPDVATDAANGLSLTTANINYNYSVDKVEPAGGVPVSFLWATGPSASDAIPNLAPAYVTTLTGDDATVGFHWKSLTWAQLSTRPTNATHLVMVLDPTDPNHPNGLIDETDETNNVASAALPQVGIPLSVTASNDEVNNGAAVFGTYLPGVALATNFSVAATDPGKVIATVKYAIDGKEAVATKSGTSWAFSSNVGALAAGAHALVVTAYDATNKPVGKFTGTIAVGGHPDFELTAGGVDSDKLRFINGVNTPVTFHGTVTGLPTFYDKMLAFAPSGTPAAVPVTRSGNTVSFDAKLSVEKLTAGLTATRLLIGKKNVTDFGDTAELVRSIDKPSWLTGGKWAFQNGSYTITSVSPRLLSLSVAPQPLGIPGVDQIIAGKQTYAKLGLTFNVTAPLDSTQTVTVNSFQVGADVTVLDKVILKKSYVPGPNLIVTGTLDSEKLTPKGLSVQMANPVTLFNGILYQTSGKVPIGPKVPGALGIDLGFGFKLQGAVTARAGFALDTDANGVVVYDQANTFAQLTAQATAHATVSVIGTFAEGLATLRATGTVDPTLTIDAQVHFGGPVSSLPTVSTSLTGTLTGTYGFSVAAQLLFGAVDIPLFDTKDNGTADDTFSFNLFKLTA